MKKLLLFGTMFGLGMGVEKLMNKHKKSSKETEPKQENENQ